MPPAETLPLRSSGGLSLVLPRWNPFILPDGSLVLFHGWFDNRALIAGELGCPPDDSTAVYAAALEAWRDDADRRIIGQYCSIVLPAGDRPVRLTRSPLRAPPLHYFADGENVAAASVPRVLEVLGLRRELNRRKLADSLYYNLTEDEGYLVGAYRVMLGETVELTPGRRSVARYYDPLDVKPQPRASRSELVEEADRLLTEACKVAIAGSTQPGAALTGGLDSSNVTARILRILPDQTRLHTFTHVPLLNHGQSEIPGSLLDEREAVEAFAALHPRIIPHFTDNSGIEFDHRLEEMFLAMGTGTVNLAPLFRWHGLFQLVRDNGCRTLLGGDAGNMTFSSSGGWAFAEYLRRGRLTQLYRALSSRSPTFPSLLRQFLVLAVVPNLPSFVWKTLRYVTGRTNLPINEQVAALRSDAIAELDMASRARSAGVLFEPKNYGTRKEMIRDNFCRGDSEGAEILQGFEQLYGTAYRDVPSYRPLVEFCLGLPTEMFMHDGISRWLGRELGKGLLPEAQRTMKGYGIQNTDWHVRFTPRVSDMRIAVEGMREDSILSGLIDTEMLEADLDAWPEFSSLDDEVYYPHAFRLPRVVAMARYVRFMTGRNE